MYWFNGLLLFSVYISFDLFLQGERISHTMFLLLHLNCICTLSSFICRFKKHMWKGEIPSWYQISIIMCWQRVNLFHTLSHLVCQISVCAMCVEFKIENYFYLCVFFWPAWYISKSNNGADSCLNQSGK